MTAPVIENFSTFKQEETTALAVNDPSGVSVGDLLLLPINAGDSTVAFGGLSNFTSIADDTYSFGVARSGLYYRIADGTAADSVTITRASAQWTAATMYRISGVDTENPIHKSTLSADQFNGDPLTSDPVTTTVDDCLIMVFSGSSICKIGSTFTVSEGSLDQHEDCFPFLMANKALTGQATDGDWDFAVSGAGIYQRTQFMTIAIAPGAAPAGRSVNSSLIHRMPMRHMLTR